MWEADFRTQDTSKIYFYIFIFNPKTVYEYYNIRVLFIYMNKNLLSDNILQLDWDIDSESNT